MKYPKIETVWMRDERGKIIPGELSDPAFAIPKSWLLSEKIDGTNVRIIYSGSDVEFRGKTDEAQLSAALFKRLQELFPVERFREVFKEAPAILFGEGYGRKVNGIKYAVQDDADVILFDVVVKNTNEERPRPEWWWLEREAVADVARKFGIPSVQEVAHLGSIEEIEAWVKKERKREDGVRMEGVVCRPERVLLRRDGTPLMFKLKWKDYGSG